MSGVLRIELKRADVRQLVAADPLLREAPFLRALGPHADDALLKGTARRYPDLAALFAQGEASDGLFFVLAGEVKLLRLDAREQIELGVAMRGDVVGEAEVLGNGGPRWCTASAKGAVDAVELPRASLGQGGVLPPELRACLKQVAHDRERACEALSVFLNRW